MQTIARSRFTTVKTEGALLPADLLQRVAEGRTVEGLRPEDYHLLPGERLNEAINRAWNRCLGAWTVFDERRHNLDASETGTTLTRERWLLVLFQELGYGRLQTMRSIEIDGVGYPISHSWDNTPIHLVSFRQDLDRRSEIATAVKRSPHSLVQELLNRSDRHQWGFVSNGLRLRILRDNVSFTRAAYVEFDLEAMMSGELYADFSLLWLVCHQSRVEGIESRESGIGNGEPEAESDSLLPAPDSPICWLEKWSQQAADQGARALDALRDGVQEAIEHLGRGFLTHPANRTLKNDLRNGDLSLQDYYRQLLRMVYRLIFLFVAEERDLLLLPGTSEPIRRRYEDFYSLRRLRERAGTLRGGPHPDLYRSLRQLFVLLRTGYAPLGLPGLGGFLFSNRATPALDDIDIANRELLDAVRALSFAIEGKVRRPVDYKNLDSEELGSVYESLLDLHPYLNTDAALFELRAAAGSERKTSGSHYTPTSLVNSLLDTALEPVVRDRLEQARKMRKMGMGSGESGIGSRKTVEGRGKGERGDSIVSGSAGVAGRDGSGGGVLSGDEGVSQGRTLRDDVSDSQSSGVGSGEYRRGQRPGESGRVYPVSAHRSGVTQGTGDTSSLGRESRNDDAQQDSTTDGAVREHRQDAAGADPISATEGEIGSGEWGIGSRKSGQSDSRFPTPHSLSPEEAAILSITVLDYASGSGHMLIGAARRLALHLARVRTGDDEPPPAEIRAALRDVVRHCIYGVDINEMAVELCKVALWMETMEPGKPLSFLDKNIQCGNSLIGVRPGLDISQIPDDAFQPVTGDDRSTATALRRRNRKEREGQLSFRWDVTVIESAEDLAQWRMQQLARLDAIAEDDIEGVRLKEAAYAQYLAENAYRQGRLEYDLWTAAFFWPMPAGDAETMLAPTQQELNQLCEGRPLDAELVQQVQEIAERHQFFHWELAFPQIFGDRESGMGSRESGQSDSPLPTPYSLPSGVDVVLSNPPWERIKLQEKEWFAARNEEIANAPNAAARTRLIRQLEREDPTLHNAFLDDRRASENESHFVRNSGAYPLCGRGDVNTYAVFSELSQQLISAVGRVGIIIPSGIASDHTTRFFFQDLVEKGSLASLYSFENEEKVFPGVHNQMKFCLLTLTGSERSTESADFFFFARQASHLNDKDRHFTLTAQEIELLNPNTRTCPIFRLKRDAELTKTIYRKIPALIIEEERDGKGILIREEENPWGISFSAMFHMSNDSSLFRTQSELSANGWVLQGNRFEKDGESYLPLYEAKFFYPYDHRYSTYENASQAEINAGRLPKTDDVQKADPMFVSLPRYWVPEWDVIRRTAQVPPALIEGFEKKSDALISQSLASWLASYWENRGRGEFGDWLIQRRLNRLGLSATIFDSIRAAFDRLALKNIEKNYPLTEQDLIFIGDTADERNWQRIAEAVIRFKCPKWLVGFRSITNATNERAAIFNLLPLIGTGNSVPVLQIPPTRSYTPAFLSASLSTYVFDYVTRQKIGGTNFNFFIVQQLPALPPEIYDSSCPWLVNNFITPTDSPLPTPHSLSAWLLPRVLELTYTAWDLQPFAQDCGYDGPPFRWDEARRFLLRCELDAAYFHLYGIERDDVDYIMETFPIVKRKDEARHGEYRTKRVILEIYDDMSRAMATGAAYQTRLDPPPADPRIGHKVDL